LHDQSETERLTHPLTELERHAVAIDELDVREAILHRAAVSERLRRLARELLREPFKRSAALLLHRLRRVVRGEELFAVVLVVRDPLGDATRHARMAAQRRVLCARQQQARTRPTGREQGRDSAANEECSLHQMASVAACDTRWSTR
jgi:hypothetical protein